MSDLHNYWPKAVGHLSAPYDNGESDHIVIAEINEAPQNGYKGVRLVRTALIPLEVVDEVLSAPGSIGHEVRWVPQAGNEAQAKAVQCQQLDQAITTKDAELRQPHSGQWGDYLAAERRKLMDQRFELRC